MTLPAPLDLLPPLLEGVWVTVQLTAGGAAVAMAAALTAGLGRIARAAVVRAAATLYVEVFRGTSALVQLFWFFYALPLFGVELTPKTAGILVLGLNIGSYGAEVVRGAIRSVPGGQLEAAVALNFSRRQRLWRIVMPQALPLMIPPAGNLAIELLKSTALVSMITLHELTFEAQLLRSETLRTPEIFGLVLLLYFLLAQLVSVATRRIEGRLAVARGHGAAS